MKRASARPPARPFPARWTEDPAKVRPMLATLVEGTLDEAKVDDPRAVYEMKYDGIRALVHIAPPKKSRDPDVVIWSRLGREKTSQFPELARELGRFAAQLPGTVLVDGEIVALDEQQRPSGFQNIQGRIHLTGAADVARVARSQPVAFYAFDLLRDGDEDLRGLPLTERRTRLEQRFAKNRSRMLTLSEMNPGNGDELKARAAREGWEGLIAKDAASKYESGRRSPHWRKLKAIRRQEFVVGGWTEPRQTRQFFGALLLGVYEDGQLRYVGHTGSGFTQAELRRVAALLKPREIKECPFAVRPKTNEPAHWVRPELVAEIKFTEWTHDDKLRHPIYVGLRDDVPVERVQREQPRGVRASGAGRETERPGERASGAGRETERPVGRVGWVGKGKSQGLPSSTLPNHPTRAARPTRPTREARPARGERAALDGLVAQLDDLETAGRDGVIALPNGDRLNVTNLRKVFWPKLKITKGELLRYYTRISPYVLPAVQDRPLVMKRFPNGIDGQAFYQQQLRKETPPEGVRIETLPDEMDPIGEPGARRFVGGSLTTLLYMTQIAAISQDPWFSRVQSPMDADYVAIDLDPMDDAPFARVLDVARWTRDELAALGAPGVPKTSGSSGLHIYIPLAPGTSYESGQLFCQIIATMVATKHPKAATIVRAVRARGKTQVYVDYLQNILGKTLATAYSARASDFAGVSTPLTWAEVDEGIDPRDFTIRTMAARVEQVGDLWARLRTSTPADLRAAGERASSAGGGRAGR